MHMTCVFFFFLAHRDHAGPPWSGRLPYRRCLLRGDDQGERLTKGSPLEPFTGEDWWRAEFVVAFPVIFFPSRFHETTVWSFWRSRAIGYQRKAG